MSDILIRSILLFNTIFIQALWVITTPKIHMPAFIKTYSDIRSIPIVFFVLFCFIQIIFYKQLQAPFIQRRIFVLEILGIITALFGVGLASWTKIVMGTNWGRPAQHDKKTQSILVTSGPFQYTRNPIYVGLFLLFIGQQIALQSYFIIISLFFFLVIQKAITIEEKLLEKYFGQEYRNYKKRVPRFIGRIGV